MEIANNAKNRKLHKNKETKIGEKKIGLLHFKKAHREREKESETHTQ